MESLLIRSCDVVLTMDDAGTEVRDGSVLIEDGVISWVGTGSPPRPSDARVIDGRGLVVTPGLINTHHHLYQSLTRVRDRARASLAGCESCTRSGRDWI